MAAPTTERTWWKDGVAYQIYPASFEDSNDDGLGDIPGIISKLDYLEDLGIDIVWISPMYKSPQVDMGYDISDYEDVHSGYGTLQDMEHLIKGCHDRKMRIILDLVINHTSNEHPWFTESRSSKTNPKRDWFIWRPPQYSSSGERLPPNNWRSNFSGSAWTFDELTGEYYLHLFAPEQPDLNWENEATRKAIYASAMTFWLEKGVDGFRIDTANMYSKGDLADVEITQPELFDQYANDVFCNGPRMHEFLREMNTQILDKYDAFTVGELPHTPDPAHVLRYVSSDDKQMSMVFQFDIVSLDKGETGIPFDLVPYKLPALKAVVKTWQSFIEGTKGWTTAFCENHDQGRSISRFASDAPEFRVRTGKMLAAWMATLSGTLYLYQGQEIGMVNCPRDWGVEEFKDVAADQVWRDLEKRKAKGELDAKGEAELRAKLIKGMQMLGRHNARTPMQWSGGANAGFCREGVQPWMRVCDDFGSCNVEAESKEEDSVLGFWKKVIRLRKSVEWRDLFVHGGFEVLDMGDEKSFTYVKTFAGRRAVVALNYTAERVPVFVGEGGAKGMKLLVSSYGGKTKEEKSEDGWLGAYEAKIFVDG